MQKNPSSSASLLDSVSARVKELERGGYARAYRHGKRRFATSTHALVGALLDAAGLEYETDQAVIPRRRPSWSSSSSRPTDRSPLVADFVVGDRLIFIETEPTASEARALESRGKKWVTVSMSGSRSDDLDSGLRVSSRALPRNERLQTIFLDDPSFNFDYAHILPKTEKCSVMHGHTSSALVEVIGETKEGMVVDFNDAKPVIKDAIAALDHKLFISEKYVVGRGREDVTIRFDTVHGPFELKVPVATTVLLDGEATVENLAAELLRRILPGMPKNVTAVGVYVYEGLNKGTHLLADVHSREAEDRRRKR